jgi:azurin
VSDSGLGFSHNRFIGLIVVIGMLVLLFEGISIFGGNIIKAQVERSTSKNHSNKNIEKRLKPATVLSEKEVSSNSQSDDGVDAVIKFVAADSCNQVIEGNDMLQFNLKEMVVSSSCSEITVTLKHTGAMPANVMGHNWVLTNTADFMPVATAGGGAGMANNYVPVNDARVIAASAVIGGGAETSVTFSGDLLSAGGDYTFFCSFPGHYAIMKGSFVVRD